MSARPKTLRRLMGVRKRLRDAAGAKAQLAEMERFDAEQHEAGLRDGLATALAAGPSTARGIRSLLLLDDTRREIEAAIGDAHQAAQAAEKRSVEARTVVREKERELRTVERKLEQVLDERERHRRREEQRVLDDLSPHRGGGR